MPEIKTKETNESVEDFLNGIADEQKRKDSFAIIELMRQATQAEPKMWGPSIIGFGDHRYKYENGRENDWFQTGFSPRKQNLTLYISGGFTGYDELLARLGKHTTGKACLYIKKLADVDMPTLRELVQQSVDTQKQE
jgi:hypothetical protein